MLNKKMRLSKNFTLEEMVATSHKGLQDTPTLDVVQNLQKLCVLVLQPLRDTIGAPVYINSGYRSKRLNARVGGVLNSRHLQGKAADIHCDNLDYAKVIFDILRQNKYVDKAIIERRRPSPNPSRKGGGERLGSRTNVSSGAAVQSRVRKNSNKFGFSLAYSYLCGMFVRYI